MKRIIKAVHSHSAITDWRILHVKKTGYQMYVIGDRLDNIRKVVTDKFFLTVYCAHNGKLGSTNLTVFENNLPTLDRRLEEAVFIAQRVRNPMFQLPGSAVYPFVETCDPTLLGDIRNVLFEKMADRLIDLVAGEKNVRLSSSEYFLDISEIHLKNSRGVDIEYQTSEIFFDGVLLAGSGADEVEMHFEPRARRLQDLPLDTYVARYSRFARDSVRAGQPRIGRYPVVLSGNALTGIFAPMVHHTSALNQYSGTSRLRVGEPIHECPGDACEPLTIISNGYIPFGLRTAPADSDGIPASRFELIENGIFKTAWSTKQYADYLGTPATGVVGNLEVPIGPTSNVDLLNGDDRVLHIVEFAAMMPDPVSGNFAAEIRLGYEHHRGSVRPVKGGSVSGNLIDCFKTARFSTESQCSNYALSLESFGSYIGPEAVWFSNFQISGE